MSHSKKLQPNTVRWTDGDDTEDIFDFLSVHLRCLFVFSIHLYWLLLCFIFSIILLIHSFSLTIVHSFSPTSTIFSWSRQIAKRIGDKTSMVVATKYFRGETLKGRNIRNSEFVCSEDNRRGELGAGLCARHRRRDEVQVRRV